MLKSMMKANKHLLIAVAVVTLWMGYGIQKYFWQRYPAIDVGVAIKTPDQFNNQLVALRGIVRTGFESGVILPENAGPRESAFERGVSLDLENSPAQFLNGFKITDKSTVYGLFQHDPNGGFGHFGIYKFQLKDAEFLFWPRVVAFVLFSVFHLLPSSLILIYIIWEIRPFAKTKE
jgi:hypothetical protein